MTKRVKMVVAYDGTNYCGWQKQPNKIEKFGEYYLQDIYDYYDFIKNSNREKDKKRIPLVKNYIKKIMDR